VIVLDASALVDWLLQTVPGRQIGARIFSHSETLHAPHVVDLEVAQVMRRMVREAVVSPQRADVVIQDLLDLRLTRYPHFLLLPHIWRMRHNLSAYDASYIALTEHLGATLITRDARLASSPGRRVRIEIF
jgi:predicted nucleic acid-binding protein